MPSKKKIVRRPRAERIEEICAAAKAAFAAHGYDGAVIADIAATADVAEGTVYKLFDNKRDLLITVMAEWYRGFIKELAESLGGIDEPRQKLRYSIWHHLRVIRDDPALCRVFFREVRAHDDYRHSALFDLNREYTKFSLDILRDGIERGDFRGDIPIEIIRDTIFGGLEHYVWQYLAGDRPLDIETATEQFWQLVVSGITTDPDHDASAAQLAPLIERLERATARIEIQ